MPSRTGSEKNLRQLLSILLDTEEGDVGAAIACGAGGCDPDDTALTTLPAGRASGPEPVGSAAYEDLWSKLTARVGREERRAGADRSSAEALYDELMALDGRGQEQAIDHDPRFGSYALAERLLTASREVRGDDQAASLELVRLGLDVAGRLGPPNVARGLVADLEARAWAYLGEGWHAQGDAAAAAEAFRLARTHLRRGSGDLLEEAEIAVLLAAAEGDLAAAVERLDRASEIYVAAGDRLRLGDVAARKAQVEALLGNHDEAVDLWRRALLLLRGLVPDRRLAELTTELARSLEAGGRADEAWSEIARARSLLAGGEPSAELEAQLRWVEGRVVAALGLPEEAERHFGAARRDLLALGRPQAAARVQLDLAALLATRQGDAYRQAMEQLAGEAADLLAAGTLEREAVSSLLLMQRAAERAALTPGLAHELSALLARIG